ncbi:carbohydrate ABC transporter permease [Marinicrinis sediminis]|uniref:Carbohydrate ABC transporter permease n=1 Tax=Marinicrinis sediminis TaxID=1652465 RepID=A0ABW5RGQ4_9BACL
MAGNKRLISVSVNAVLLFVSAIMVVPLLLFLNISLKTKEEFLKFPYELASSFQWSNFTEAWQQAELGIYFQNSFIYALGSAALIAITASLAAFPIARQHFKGANLLYAIFMIALFLPGAIVPTLFLMNKLALINTMHGFILLQAGGGLSIAVFIFVSFVKSLPKDLDEAAWMDGCGYFRYIFRIIFPLMKPAIATVTMLQCIGSWNDFINPYLYLHDKELRPLTSGVYLFVGKFTVNWPLLAAAIILVACPLILLFIFLQRFIISGITSGSVKG